MTCDPGTWTGSPDFSFQWLRDGAAIAGATSSTYTVTAEDAGTAIELPGDGDERRRQRVRRLERGRVPRRRPRRPAASAPAAGHLRPRHRARRRPPSQTIRGDAAFTQGTSSDLYLACTRLDLRSSTCSRPAARRVSVTGVADLRLAGQTAEILLDGKRVGTRRDRAPTGASPRGSRRRPPGAAPEARYQARVGSTSSQRLLFQRRMVATSLTRRARSSCCAEGSRGRSPAARRSRSSASSPASGARR